jgi:mortality factor 4-like protein 1
MLVMSSSFPKYDENETILAWHGELIYKAKVMKVRPEAELYFLHYQGWKNRWDEWVGPQRMLKDDAQGRAIQAECRQKLAARRRGGKSKASTSNTTNKRKASSTPRGDSKSSKRSKRKKGDKDKLSVNEDEEDSLDIDISRKGNRSIKISIPGALKKELLDDYNSIVKHSKLVKLPLSMTVNKILNHYVKSKNKNKNRSSISEPVAAEICNGLRVLFDRALPTALLYRFEVPQYVELFPDDRKDTRDKMPSDVYGLPHLLRLFVKLPSLLVFTAMDQNAVNALQKQLSDLFKFITKNQSEFSVQTYNPPADMDKYKSQVSAFDQALAEKLATTASSSSSSSSAAAATAAEATSESS